jgi:hypothetical protein
MATGKGADIMSPVEVQDRTESARVLEGVQYGVSTNGDALTMLHAVWSSLCMRLPMDASDSIALTWELDAGYSNELGRGKLTWRVVITTKQHKLERWEP